ncbi:GGDEF domain-containing protein [Eubacterium sp. AM49-13BH]|nr:GGDEF domain-containing protein [Eubacterium sp. AM49-13BH]
MGINFLDIVHQDNLKDFKMVFETLKPGENCRMLILLRNGIGEYYWTDMVISNNGKILSGENVIEVRCYFLSAVESRYLMALDNVNKYRTILSTYRNYLFDYNSYTDMFTIYLYRGNQCNAPIKVTLEQFSERMLRILRSDSERKEFATFYNYLKNGSNMFSCMVYLPLDEHNDELYKFKVNGDSLFSTNKTSVVAGYLETVDGCVSDVIPYYATSEAVDSATGLLNKRACMEYTKSVIASKDDKIHYIIMFDVDNFKSINDTYGHLFGDEVLSKIAGIINANLNGRGIAGRFGGDEFYIFTDNIKDEEDLRILLTTMRKELQYAFDSRIEDFGVTLSVGVSLFPKDGTDYEELFRKADKCLYFAKEKGRNRFIIYNESKHGSLENNSRHIHKILDLSDHSEYMSGVVSDIILELVSRGKDAIDDVANNIIEQFEIDGLRIYNDNSELIYSCGEYKRMPDMTNILNDKAFLSRYNKNNSMSIGIVSSVEAWHKELYNELSDSNIMAFISTWFEFKYRRYYFFYDVFNHRAAGMIMTETLFLL